MKKILLSAAIALAAIPAFAEFTGSGYYRVQSAATQRYAYLLDNTGSYSAQTSSADVNALGLISGFLRASSDPASVFYVTKVSQSGDIYTCDIAGQGTSIHQFLDAYLKVWKKSVVNGQQAYWFYAEKSGLVKYLGDIQDNPNKENGWPSAEAKGEYRNWWMWPMVTDSESQYFGVAPSLTVGSKYYHPMYASFDFDAASAGVSAYIVKKVENGVAIIERVEGIVPAGTPVIMECEHPLATDNRLNVGPAGSKADVAGNQLKGVYFDNDMTTHWNRTKYNKDTMRLLGVKDGKLQFVTSDIEYLPRNESYLSVSAGTESNLLVMTQAEYDEYVKYPTEIKLSDSALDLEVGDTYALTATLAPSFCTEKDITWTSSDDAVATVTSTGMVTVLGEGRAEIKAETANGLSAVCIINAVTGVEQILLSGEAEFFDLNGLRIENPAKGGVYVVRHNGKSFVTILK